jgi:catechol 2,3-dioxygenase-like lactoylglutathione lyase family enzyme
MIAGGTVSLAVTDMPRALRFYVETLGLKLIQDLGPHRQVLDVGNETELSLISAAIVTQGSSEFAMRVREYDAAIAIYENRGIVFRQVREGNERRAHFTDSEGNPLALVARD